MSDNRNPDGTFKAGNNAASTDAETVPATRPNEGMPASVDPSRNADGTYAKGSGATNPDNFANKSEKEVKDLATEGGKASH